MFLLIKGKFFNYIIIFKSIVFLSNRYLHIIASVDCAYMKVFVNKSNLFCFSEVDSIIFYFQAMRYILFVIKLLCKFSVVPSGLFTTSFLFELEIKLELTGRFELDRKQGFRIGFFWASKFCCFTTKVFLWIGKG